MQEEVKLQVLQSSHEILEFLCSQMLQHMRNSDHINVLLIPRTFKEKKKYCLLLLQDKPLKFALSV